MEDEQIEQYRRKAIGMLRAYKYNKVQIDMLQSMIKEVSRRTDVSNMAVSYDQPSRGHTNKVSSVVEAALVSKERELERLQNELARAQGQVERVDIALGNMPYPQRTLLKLKYVDGLMWKQIVQHLAYSEEYIRKQLKRSAVDMLTGYLYPEINYVNLFEQTQKSPVIGVKRCYNDSVEIRLKGRTSERLLSWLLMPL